MICTPTMILSLVQQFTHLGHGGIFLSSVVRSFGWYSLVISLQDLLGQQDRAWNLHKILVRWHAGGHMVHSGHVSDSGGLDLLGIWIIDLLSISIPSPLSHGTFEFKPITFYLQLLNRSIYRPVNLMTFFDLSCTTTDDGPLDIK